MTGAYDGPRWRAATAATLLVLSGAILGILVDRHWISPPESQAAPLTAETMAEDLRLTEAQEAALRMLLDSLHTEIATAAAQGADSLQAATDRAHHRIAESLPPESRGAFHAWMQGHHEGAMRRIHDAPR